MSARDDLQVLMAEAAVAARAVATRIETFTRERGRLEGTGQRLEGRWRDVEALAAKCRVLGGDSAGDIARLTEAAREAQGWLDRQQEAELQHACETARGLIGALGAIGAALEAEVQAVHAVLTETAAAAAARVDAARAAAALREEEERLRALEAEREGRRDVLAEWAARNEKEEKVTA